MAVFRQGLVFIRFDWRNPSNAMSLKLEILDAVSPLLRERLLKLNKFANTTVDCEPTLTVRLARTTDVRLDPQGFMLTWNPGGDLTEIFDPRFARHGETGVTELSVPLHDSPYCGTITGTENAGLLYGISELLERCEVRNCLPPHPLDVRRLPALPLRSACLQLMKRGKYIVPITPSEFPWFFNKTWCLQYLDFLLEHRFNKLTLWNFHPFPYFCPIDNHPEVVEIDHDALCTNAEHLRWLIDAAKIRGIQILWHFYNIYVPPSYASAHGLNSLHNQFTAVQEKQVFSYIRDSVRSFANAFPEVGFVACIGEGVPARKAERYAAEVLVTALNETQHRPTLVIRQWSTLSASEFERQVGHRYSNLYAMIKHNAEHIAGTMPDARVRDWVATGVPVIVNMHMLSEIGPFRWAPPAYIREICLHYKALGAVGVHVYPHWPWRTPKVGDRHYQKDELHRDWLYHAAWGRYSFDPVRDPDEERRHWIRQLRHSGLPDKIAAATVDAYEASGAAMPRLQQHLWVHYDNHSVLPAGLTLGQMRFARSIHGRKEIQTDRLEDFLPLRAELNGASIQSGEYSFDNAAEQSTQELDRAIAFLKAVNYSGQEESMRLYADILSMKWTVEYLRLKARIAGLLLRYDRDPSATGLLKQAVDELRRSVDLYCAYRDHAEQGYEGISDVPPYFPFYNYQSVALPYTWSDCLDVFQRELANVETFANAVLNNQPWSLIHHFGFDRVDPRRQLESELTDGEGLWLTGDPDFIPWSRHLARMKRMILLPSSSEPYREISILSDLTLIRSWIEDGGHLTLLTLADSPWVEAHILSDILRINMRTLNPQTIQYQYGRVLTIQADKRWIWNERSGDHGICGQLPLGRGQIKFHALHTKAASKPSDSNQDAGDIKNV